MCSEFRTIQLATYTEAQWTAWNGVLAVGQFGFSSDALIFGTDQMKWKVGNGVDTWTMLDYVPFGGSVVFPYIILRSTGTDAHRWKFTVDDSGMLSQPGEDLGV